MGTSWRIYAAASIAMFLIMFTAVAVISGSSQVVELTDERVNGYAYAPREGLVLVATEDGLEAFRLDGSMAWSVGAGSRACAASPSPDGEYVAAYIEMNVTIVRASDGEVLRSYYVGTTCVANASLVWGPGGDALVGNSGLERLVAVNTSDGYTAHSEWLRADIVGIDWINKTHAIAVGHGYGVGRAYLIRAEPLTIEDNITFEGRAWIVDRAVVVLSNDGEAWKWVPGEGTAWRTGLGSGIMAADIGDGVVFALTKDFRVAAINASDGSVAWSPEPFKCDVRPNDYRNHFRGVFEVRGRAVGVAGIVLGHSGACSINAVFVADDGALERVPLHRMTFEGWLSDDTALLTGRDSSAILNIRTGEVRPLNALYSYVAPMPYGAIVTRYVPPEPGEPPKFITWSEYMAPDGRTQPLPRLGCCRIVGLAPSRALIIRERGAALLIIGPANPATNLMISVPLLAAGAALALLAYREWRIENRDTTQKT